MNKTLIFLSALLSIVNTPTQAEKLPLFELGIGPGAITQSYYTGSKETRNIYLPAIIPIYRGETFRSDDEGVRAELFEDKRFKLDLSVEVNLGVNSSKIPLRRDMPDIDALLQLGPSLKITLEKSDHHEWIARFPLRAAITVGDEFGTAGFSFAPDITYLREIRFMQEPWRLGLSLGPLFGTADYHAIYYNVDPAYATDTRPAYEADGGFSGSRGLVTFSSKNKKRITSWFLRYDNLSGAVYEDSPMVETDGNLTAGFIYSWMLFKSKKMTTES